MRQLRWILLWMGCAPLVALALDVHVLDVGEGQAILLRHEQHALLIDTGHAGQAAAVLKRMRSLRVEQLDLLLLSHLHADHASGYFRIVEEFPEVEILSNCYPLSWGEGGDIARWVNDALEANPRAKCIGRGDRLQWRDSELTILWPKQPLEPRAGLNHSSLVILVEKGERRLLIMGDADQQAEQAILQYQLLPEVDVLVVGHHGAADASSRALLEAIRPDYAVISVNKDNLRGYPSPEILERLQAYSGHLHQTWQQGEFYLSLD